MKNTIEIRFCNENDILNVMNFIKDNWNENHILANNKFVMEYEHFWNNKFNYVIAYDNLNNKICGICGIIPYTKNYNIDISAGIWRAIKTSNFLTGTNILKFIQENTKCRSFLCCGINKDTIKLREYLGHKIGKLNHYYRLNNKSEYSICIVNNKNIMPIKQKDELYLFEIFEINDIKNKFDIYKYKDRITFKDWDYIEHRYFKHFKYKYKFLCIGKNENFINSIIIAKEIIFDKNTKVLRIIDFIGNESDLPKISHQLNDILVSNGYEYIDFYCYGISNDIFYKMGFNIRDDEDTNVIPNYFEPFEQKNIDIYFSIYVDKNYKSLPIYIFKGDADQDRPNKI
ncbi:hypothetical protein [[Clostridium] colinum]|uniref:hypothetical protein n=1 Tax=[Clostridium] colinum TaxID=36835 RepID=UPI002024102C|nr:hypothetical protein [[Clostridium] colinum]